MMQLNHSYEFMWGAGVLNRKENKFTKRGWLGFPLSFSHKRKAEGQHLYAISYTDIILGNISESHNCNCFVVCDMLNIVNWRPYVDISEKTGIKNSKALCEVGYIGSAQFDATIKNFRATPSIDEMGRVVTLKWVLK